MDNHGPPYQYNHSYGYPYGSAPYPPQNSGYPPQNSAPVYPPPSSNPYPPGPPHHHHHYPPPYQYPPPGPPTAMGPGPQHGVNYSSPSVDYHPSSPAPYPYPYAAPPPPGPVLEQHPSFQYGSHQPGAYAAPPPPGPVLEQHPSFQYGSHQPGAYASPEVQLQNSGSFSGHLRQDSLSSLPTGPALHHQESAGVKPPSLYPSLDNVMSNMHLSDNRPEPSAPASPPAPAVVPEPISYPPGAGYDMPPRDWGNPPSTRYDVPVPPRDWSNPPSTRYDNQANFYGYPNDSFSSNYEPTYPAPPTYPVPSGHSGPLEGPALSGKLHSNSNSFSESQSASMQIVPHKGSLKVLLLHGNLDICIYEAKNLPNMDMFHKTLGDVFGMFPGNASSKIESQVNGKSSRITSDPYVTISVSNAVIGRTYVISNSENPVWMQHFNVPVAHQAAEVQFVVKDSDIVGSQVIGVVTIPVEQLYAGVKIEGTYPVLGGNGKPCKPGATLRLAIQYIPIHNLSFYHHGVGAGPDYIGVPDTYYPLRRGGRVTLYQDAHVPDGSLPNLKLEQGMYYAHGKCWHDIFDAIRQARRLIYITGWSVWHKVSLVRDAGNPSESTLGDLLRNKSAEGVRVLLLIWDDPTSRSILGYRTDGVMQTHDEETRRFFKHSSVQVLLCPRNAGKRHSWMKQREVETIYTHHQKTVIVDADAPGNRRKIIAFVGGLDLCDGRYDTPEHHIFRTLKTVHSDDFHNPTFTGSVIGCPREPWHDLHSKIDGPAAYDVLDNFEKRWLKASKPSGIKKLKKTIDDSLLRLERIPDIIGINDSYGVSADDPESWHVQVFRSIDSNSVKDFPKDPKDATSKNLVCGKNILIDMSIHTAYVKAIRAAQHFIYIENQYFIGSSFNWSSHKDLGANNLIPMEIALKIANKIRANERFAVYIVIPMWPEGVPTGAATQRILFWQNKTMQMMYETIYKALFEVGLHDKHTPQDYLNFFCLGNREALDSTDNTFSSGSPAEKNTPQALVRNSRRFMIYVHSKGMIVDDEFVILGSANINQRSMEGTRDTEIAMGAYQPQHTWARKLSNPRGQIYGYRMSLWAEHTGTVEDCFAHPESLECVQRVRQMGELNWKQYAAEEVTEMRGHLMKYPVDVDRKGKVRPLPGQESFPDVGGNICGSFLAIQENLTI